MKIEIKIGDRIVWKGRGRGLPREYSGRVVEILYREKDKVTSVEIDTEAPDDNFTFSMTDVINEITGREDSNKWCYASQIKSKVE